MSESPYNGDKCLEARVRVLEAVLEERQRAVDIAVKALDDRLHLLNELRGDVLTKAEYNKAHEALLYRIESVEKTHSKFVGVTISMIALAGLIGAVLSHLVFK